MRHEIKVHRGKAIVHTSGVDAPTASSLLDGAQRHIKAGDYVVLTTWLPRTRSTTHFEVVTFHGLPRLKQKQQVSEAIRDLKVAR